MKFLCIASMEKKKSKGKSIRDSSSFLILPLFLQECSKDFSSLVNKQVIAWRD